MKTWAQICKHFYKHFYISCLKTQKQQLHFVKKKKKKKIEFKLSGHKSVRAGRSALRNMPSWNTALSQNDTVGSRDIRYDGVEFLEAVVAPSLVVLRQQYRSKWLLNDQYVADTNFPIGLKNNRLRFHKFNG